jgi:hypothetical protein
VEAAAGEELRGAVQDLLPASLAGWSSPDHSRRRHGPRLALAGCR